MCIFCDIIDNKIPSYKVYEDDLVIAFLDITQVTRGHTLIIPKKHVSHMLECDTELLAHLMRTAQKIGNQILSACGALGMNILSNVNEVAGQTIPHFHVHLIPRYHHQDACLIQFNESEPQNLMELKKQISFN